MYFRRDFGARFGLLATHKSFVLAWMLRIRWFSSLSSYLHRFHPLIVLFVGKLIRSGSLVHLEVMLELSLGDFEY